MKPILATIPVHPGPAPDLEYTIHIGRGLWEVVAGELCAFPLGDRHVLVTDDTVSALHGGRLAAALRGRGLRVDVVELAAGEEHKNRETLALLTDRMVSLGVGRDGVILALGGGVVGDLAGFAAATYHRGIPFVHLPTTLLAMVDSSIGGKTGHDVPGGKNLVGAFHQPRAVYTDLDVLSTLPEEQRRIGFSEVIKHAMVADAGLLRFVEDHAGDLMELEKTALLQVVVESIGIKVAKVTEDVHESGVRAVLNFGHTVAHALETVSGYSISHGEAVAMGMVAEASLSVQRDLLLGGAVERLRAVLRSFGLPTDIGPSWSGAALWKACLRDKKVRGGEVRCVLLEDVGRVARCGAGWTFAVQQDEMMQALGL